MFIDTYIAYNVFEEVNITVSDAVDPFYVGFKEVL